MSPVVLGMLLASTLAVVATPAAAQPSDLPAARLVAHVPASMDAKALAEVERLHPGVWDLRPYEGRHFVREEGAVVVVFQSDRMAGMKDPHPLGLSWADRRVIAVYTREVERLACRSMKSAQGQVAVARVVAHELEHILRGSQDHDRDGWFHADLTAQDLTSPLFGWDSAK